MARRKTARPSGPKQDTGRPESRYRMCTDLGNAERLADQTRDKLLWVYGMGWLWWDGKRWRRDESNHVAREATETVRSIYPEAAAAQKRASEIADPDRREEQSEIADGISKWARRSESAPRIGAMIQLGKAQPRLVLEEGAEGLDADPMALNVQNGILDLETFELRDHDPAERHTRVTNAGYNPEAEAPFFTATVKKALPDAELRRWFQKAMGYSLRGSLSEFLFVPHGGGANLKSTSLAGPRFALGDYACEAPSDLLVARREWSAGSESALAGLQGQRLVTTTETERSKKLAEVLAKKLTGETEITAKFMRQDYFTYRNQTAVWLATNYKPVVQGTDLAIWRRIKLIPFDVTIPERERLDMEEVEGRLRDELDGILAWLVEGLRLYQEERLLPEPDAVRTATEAYQEEMDPLSDFLDQYFVEDSDGVVPISTVDRLYQEYMRGRSGTLGHREFNARMEEHGFERPKKAVWIDDKSRKVWKGLKVRHGRVVEVILDG